jgi:putative tricarboxylic transport membrane protein
MGDRILGGIGLLLAAFFIWQATTIQISFISDPIGPKTFPIIIGVLLGVSSLVILLRPDPNPDWPPLLRLAEIGMAVAALVIYAYALPWAGFVISTAAAAAFLGWRLGSRPLPALLAGIATSGGIYIVFHLILGLSLARGPLGI